VHDACRAHAAHDEGEDRAEASSAVPASAALREHSGHASGCTGARGDGLAELLMRMAQQSSIRFGEVLRGSLVPGARFASTSSWIDRRHRDLLPLPLRHGAEGTAASTIVHFMSVALSYLGSCFTAVPPAHQGNRPRLAAAQRSTFAMLEARAAEHRQRLHEGGFDPVNFSLRPFCESDAGKAGPIVSCRVDLPEQAATCDPAALVPARWWKAATDVGTIFKDVRFCTSSSLPPVVEPRAAQEYLKLVARELGCGRLGLARQAYAGGRVFGMEKPVAAGT
jgi:hypothetical protein